MNRVKVKSLANNTVMEIQFVTVPRRGWFKENIEPIVTIIKTQIPATQRSYDPATYKWEIAMEFWMPIQVVLEALGFKIEHVSDASDSGPEVPKDYAENFYNEPAPAQAASENVAEKLAELLNVHDLGPFNNGELKTMYRKCARALHPDLGGDAAKMSELNRLWSLYNA